MNDNGNQGLVDVTQSRQKMAAVADNTVYGTIGDAIKTKTIFALGGAAVGYGYAVMHRIDWKAPLVIGLLGGGLVGWGFSLFFMEDN